MSSGPIYPLAGVVPRVAAGVFVAPTAAVIGDVELAEGSSVWFGTVIRGDVGPIRVGARTNIQDLACIHATGGVSETTIGEDVTVGHGAIIHGCTIEHDCLIGMGSVILDNAVIGAGSVIAAGAVVPPRMIVPPGSFVAGLPAKVLRPVTAEQRAMGRLGAEHYVAGARAYLAETWARPASDGDREAGRGGEP